MYVLGTLGKDTFHVCSPPLQCFSVSADRQPMLMPAFSASMACSPDERDLYLSSFSHIMLMPPLCRMSQAFYCATSTRTWS